MDGGHRSLRVDIRGLRGFDVLRLNGLGGERIIVSRDLNPDLQRG